METVSSKVNVKKAANTEIDRVGLNGYVDNDMESWGDLYTKKDDI
jgi:hypothetical protein